MRQTALHHTIGFCGSVENWKSCHPSLRLMLVHTCTFPVGFVELVNRLVKSVETGPRKS